MLVSSFARFLSKIAVICPTCVETQATMNRLKWGKAPGIYGNHAELLKAGGNAEFMSLHAVLCSAWNTGIIPTDWKRGLVVPLWKGKGDRQDCSNYRGVTLLSVPGKIFARIILDGIATICLSISIQSSQALHQRGQRLTVSLHFGSSPNAAESFSRGCWQPMLNSAKHSIQ